MNRCNLTVLFEPVKRIQRVFHENGVDIVTSLPDYSSENVDKQRGDGALVKVSKDSAIKRSGLR